MRAAFSLAAIFSAASRVACAAEPGFPMPMTAEELVRYDSADALAAYLGQPDASLAVCDARSRGPHVARLDEDARTALVDGLVEGRVVPARWLACTSALLATAPPEDAVAMLAAVGHAYRSLVKDGSFEATPAMQERVGVMQKLYLGRSNAVRDARHELEPLKLGRIASWYGTQLLAVVDLKRGSWKGRRVDEKVLDEITAEKDEETL